MELNGRVFRIVYNIEEGDESEAAGQAYSEFQNAVSQYTIGMVGIMKIYDYLREIPDG